MTGAPKSTLNTPACESFAALLTFPGLTPLPMGTCPGWTPRLAPREHDQGPRHSKLTTVTSCLHLFPAYVCRSASFPLPKSNAIHTWAIDPLIDTLP